MSYIVINVVVWIIFFDEGYIFCFGLLIVTINIRGIIGCVILFMLVGVVSAENVVCVEDYSNDELSDLVQSISGTKVLDYSGEGDCSVVVRHGFSSEDKKQSASLSEDEELGFFLRLWNTVLTLF